MKITFLLFHMYFPALALQVSLFIRPIQVISSTFYLGFYKPNYYKVRLRQLARSIQ